MNVRYTFIKITCAKGNKYSSQLLGTQRMKLTPKNIAIFNVNETANFLLTENIISRKNAHIEDFLTKIVFIIIKYTKQLLIHINFYMLHGRMKKNMWVRGWRPLP